MTPSNAPLSIAVVGGGISGLASAHFLAKAGVEVTLHETQPRFGGPVGTIKRKDFLLEGGADSFLTRPSTLVDVVKELGLADQLIAPTSLRPPVMLWSRGELRPLPEGTMLVVPTNEEAFRASGLLTDEGTTRLFEEEHLPVDERLLRGDVSILDFFDVRFGTEAMLRLVSPMLTGIYSGQAHQLSVNATFPRFVKMLREHGSLIAGAKAAMKAREEAAKQAESAANSESIPGSPFLSLKEGMGWLIDTWVVALRKLPNVQLRSSTTVRAIKKTPTGVEVERRTSIASKSVFKTYDAVVLAVPAPAMLGIEIDPALVSPAARDAAAAIPHASSAAVTLAYNEKVGLPQVAGVMLPQSEKGPDDRVWRARSFQLSSNKLPRAPEGSDLVRVFFGGVDHESWVRLFDDELAMIARSELKRALGVTAKPTFEVVSRFLKHRPQYTVGHAQRVATVEAGLDRNVVVVGTSYHGVGLPACVDAARRLVGDLLTRLG